MSSAVKLPFASARRARRRCAIALAAFGLVARNLDALLRLTSRASSRFAARRLADSLRLISRTCSRLTVRHLAPCSRLYSRTPSRFSAYRLARSLRHTSRARSGLAARCLALLLRHSSREQSRQEALYPSPRRQKSDTRFSCLHFAHALNMFSSATSVLLPSEGSGAAER